MWNYEKNQPRSKIRDLLSDSLRSLESARIQFVRGRGKCGYKRKNKPRSQIRDLLSDSLRSLESARIQFGKGKVGCG